MKNTNPYFFAIFSIAYFLIFFQLIGLIHELFFIFYARGNFDKLEFILLESVAFLTFIFFAWKIFVSLLKLINLKIVLITTALILLKPVLLFWLMSLLPPNLIDYRTFNFDYEEILNLRSLTELGLILTDYLFISFLFFSILYKQNRTHKENYPFFIAIFSISFYLIFKHISKIIGEIYFYFFKISPDLKILLSILLSFSLFILILLSWQLFKKYIKILSMKILIVFLVTTILLSVLQSSISSLSQVQITDNNISRSDYLNFYGITKSLEFIAFILFLFLLFFQSFRTNQKEINADKA
ncbi:MAG: hypothetical protein RBT46_00275 [Weeksellaceae bacterium]|jgi:hypothetical protein|nr:hypothetical protein [Weeksellaceae bacterium]